MDLFINNEKKNLTVRDPTGIRTVFRVAERSVKVFEVSLACGACDAAVLLAAPLSAVRVARPLRWAATAIPELINEDNTWMHDNMC